MNTVIQNASLNGRVQETEALDKPAGEAAAAARPKSPLDGIEEGLRADRLESLGWLRRYGMGVAEWLAALRRRLASICISKSPSPSQRCALGPFPLKWARGLKPCLRLNPRPACGERGPLRSNGG
jgi:hypothetical protein